MNAPGKPTTRVAAAAATAAIVVAAAAGCSTIKSSTGKPSAASSNDASNAEPAGASSEAPPVLLPPGRARAIIDGQDQNTQGLLWCTSEVGAKTIVFTTGPTTWTAKVTDGEPPQVINVGFVNVVGLAALAYDSSTGDDHAEATRNGSSYRITANATGVNLSNLQPVKKSFLIDATCP